MRDDDCKCGKESEVACHGLKDGVIYDEYYCYECYWKKE